MGNGNPPPDGRIPSLPTLSSTLSGTEMMYIVSPGNNQAGISYNILLSQLAGFFSAYTGLNVTTLTTGNYTVQPTDARVLVNKTVGSPTTVTLPIAALMEYPSGVIIKDLKGDAATNNITVALSGGQLVDGLATIVISNNYGWVEVVPTPNGTAWYQLR